jgi:hypothetical protein
MRRCISCVNFGGYFPHLNHSRINPQTLSLTRIYFMKRTALLFASSLLALMSAAPALATQVYWTDWTTSNNATSADGEIHIGTSVVDVAYAGTGAHNFVQTGTGINYWTGNAYTQGSIVNAPPAAELVALNTGGKVTVTFSQPVLDPYIALTSWNGNTVNFGQTISFESVGQGYWGSGTPILNTTQTGFTGNGEVHGVISLKGTYNALTFTHTSENWHGFTVGVSAVPEPATYWMFATGLILLVPAARKIAASR